jgi:hypothetical protein
MLTITFIHTAHALFLKGYQRYFRYSYETPTFYKNLLAMKNTADQTGGMPIAVLLQSISGVSAFYDIHGGKRDVVFFYFVPDTTRDY